MARKSSQPVYDSDEDAPRPAKRRRSESKTTQRPTKSRKRKSSELDPHKTAKKASKPKSNGLSSSQKGLRTPPVSKRRKVPTSVSRGRTPAALRLGTYLIEGPAPEPESSGDDELLITGRVWAARVIRSTKKRRVSNGRSVPGGVGGQRRSAGRRSSLGNVQEQDEEPQDTFAYTRRGGSPIAALAHSFGSPEAGPSGVHHVFDDQAANGTFAEPLEGAGTYNDDGERDNFVWDEPVAVPEHRGSPLRGEAAREVERVIESISANVSREASDDGAGRPSNAQLFLGGEDEDVDEDADTVLDEISSQLQAMPNSPFLAGDRASRSPHPLANELIAPSPEAEAEPAVEDEPEEDLPFDAAASGGDSSAEEPIEGDDVEEPLELQTGSPPIQTQLNADLSEEEDEAAEPSTTVEDISMDVSQQPIDVDEDDEEEGSKEQEEEEQAHSSQSAVADESLELELEEAEPESIEEQVELLAESAPASPSQSLRVEEAEIAAVENNDRPLSPQRSPSPHLEAEAPPSPPALQEEEPTREVSLQPSMPAEEDEQQAEEEVSTMVEEQEVEVEREIQPHIDASPASAPVIDAPATLVADAEEEDVQPIEVIAEAAQEEDAGMDTDSTEEVLLSLTTDSPRARQTSQPVMSTPRLFGRRLVHSLSPDASPIAPRPDAEVVEMEQIQQLPRDDALRSPEPRATPEVFPPHGLTPFEGSPAARAREPAIELDSEEEAQLRRSPSPDPVKRRQSNSIEVADAAVADHIDPGGSPARDDEAAAGALRRLSLSPVEELAPARSLSPAAAAHRSPARSETPGLRDREELIELEKSMKPRKSFTELMKGGESDSEDERPADQIDYSGLISPTDLVLASPGQAQRLQSLLTSNAQSTAANAAQPIPVAASPAPAEEQPIAPKTPEPVAPGSPAHTPRSAAALSSRLSRLLGLGDSGKAASEKASPMSDDSLRDTPVHERTLPQTPRQQDIDIESDDSLRDTPVKDRTEQSIMVPRSSPRAQPLLGTPIQLASRRSTEALEQPHIVEQTSAKEVEAEESPPAQEAQTEPSARSEEAVVAESEMEVDEVEKEQSPAAPARAPTPQPPTPAARVASPAPPVASTSRIPIVSSPERSNRDLSANDLLVDDHSLYSKEAFDPSHLVHPQPQTSGSAMRNIYAYARSSSPAPVEPMEEDEQELEAPIYAEEEPVEDFTEADIVVRDPDSEEAATYRRSSLGNRPPTPGRAIRGSVFIATPGTPPEKAPRLSPTVTARSTPNLRVILQPRQPGMPRTAIPAPPRDYEQSDNSLASEIARAGSSASELLQRAISPVQRAPRPRRSSKSAAQATPARVDRIEHDKESYVEIRSSDPKLAARVAALLKVEHRFISEDNSQEDSMQAEQSMRLLHEAEEEVASHFDEESLAGRRRSQSPFFPRHHRSHSAASASRTRQHSANDTFNVPPDFRHATPMAPLGQRVGDHWTKDDWRRLEQVLREEQTRSEANGVDEPSDEEIARVFLFAEGVMRDQCERHWSWDKLTIRVHALRQTRCRPRSRSMSHGSPVQRGQAGPPSEVGSHVSSVAFEHYRADPPRPRPVIPYTSTPFRAASAPPVPPPTASGGLLSFMQNRQIRPTTSTVSVLGDSTPSVEPARRGLLSMLGLAASPQSSSRKATEGSSAPASRRPPVPLFHDTSPPRRRPIESQSEPGNVSLWAQGVEAASEVVVPPPANVSQQIEAIEERERSYQEEPARSPSRPQRKPSNAPPPASRLPRRTTRKR